MLLFSQQLTKVWYQKNNKLLFILRVASTKVNLKHILQWMRQGESIQHHPERKIYLFKWYYLYF